VFPNLSGGKVDEKRLDIGQITHMYVMILCTCR